MSSNKVMCVFVQICTVICAFLPFNVCAANNNLQTLLNNIQTMQAEFKQTVYSESNKTLQEYKGQMAFKKPNSFRWEVTDPDPTLLVTNGKKLWNYDPGLEQVTIQMFDPSAEITPLSFILDDVKNLATNFNVTPLPHNCYNLIPKVENANFVNVELCFNQNIITSMRVLDHVGQNTQFEFSHVKNNTSIKDEQFAFKTPRGVDVVGG